MAGKRKFSAKQIAAQKAFAARAKARAHKTPTAKAKSAAKTAAFLKSKGIKKGK